MAGSGRSHCRGQGRIRAGLRSDQVAGCTSMPSLLMMVLSILSMAAFIVRGGGSFVRPILMALERFVSSTVIDFLPVSSCFCNKISAVENSMGRK